MKTTHVQFLILVLSSAFAGAVGAQTDSVTDPLPSWNDGPAKQAILSFVETATTEGSPKFVAPDERIATFDNDGTLWCEHPTYTQLAFALDRVNALAPEHPEWKTTQPFKAVLDYDRGALGDAGVKGMIELVMASHAGMSTNEFEDVAIDWFKTARHPRFGRPYNELVYQPMLEWLTFLRSNGFKTCIVSGGGVEFMRPITKQAYGIPREQVMGSTIKTSFELQDGKPVLMRLPELDFIDDKTGKPINIDKFIGKQPIIAAGNSDGDYEMLQYTTIDNPRPSLGLIVHHTDADREYAYDRDTQFGRLEKALDEAKDRGWIIVDMQSEWKEVFPAK